MIVNSVTPGVEAEVRPAGNFRYRNQAGHEKRQMSTYTAEVALEALWEPRTGATGQGMFTREVMAVRREVSAPSFDWRGAPAATGETDN